MWFPCLWKNRKKRERVLKIRPNILNDQGWRNDLRVRGLKQWWIQGWGGVGGWIEVTIRRILKVIWNFYKTKLMFLKKKFWFLKKKILFSKKSFNFWKQSLTFEENFRFLMKSFFFLKKIFYFWRKFSNF